MISNIIFNLYDINSKFLKKIGQVATNNFLLTAGTARVEFKDQIHHFFELRQFYVLLNRILIVL